MSNPIRNGKIARLPKALREEINQRLERGATAKSLVGWLNGLPEVQALVRAEFDGHPIREQNLSQWKNGGYRDWLRHEEALAVAEHLYERGGDLKAQGAGRMPTSEALSLWLTSRYIVATKEIEALKGEAAWRKQRQMCTDLMKIRRAEQQAERLQLDRERMELRQEELEFKRACAEGKHPGVGEGSKAGASPTAKGQGVNEAIRPAPNRAGQSGDDQEKSDPIQERPPENRQPFHDLNDAEEAERLLQIFGRPRKKFVDPDHRRRAA